MSWVMVIVRARVRVRARVIVRARFSVRVRVMFKVPVETGIKDITTGAGGAGVPVE